MPWKPMKVVDLRLEFTELASHEAMPMSRLCQRFGISRKTGYKWLRRYRLEGKAGLADHSRTPFHVSHTTPARVEQAILKLRTEHPAWGARKLWHILTRRGITPVPAMSTITRILHRNGLIGLDGKRPSEPFRRFEHPVPNALWQMDFKGWFRTLAAPCHPLTILDDHSRFDLCLEALANEQTLSVKTQLERVFERYGLPDTILTDNGSPWGSDLTHVYTPLTVWLMLLGVKVVHIRPYHPQTQGKEERFHRTLKKEVISTRQWRDLADCQRAFDAWRIVYNHERPHESLGGDVPAKHYRPSLRPFPDRQPTLEYPSMAILRKVQQGGFISFRGVEHSVPKAFRGYRLRLIETGRKGHFEIFFGINLIKSIDIDNTQKVLPMSPVRV